MEPSGTTEGARVALELRALASGRVHATLTVQATAEPPPSAERAPHAQVHEHGDEGDAESNSSEPEQPPQAGVALARLHTHSRRQHVRRARSTRGHRPHGRRRRGERLVEELDVHDEDGVHADELRQHEGPSQLREEHDHGSPQLEPQAVDDNAEGEALVMQLVAGFDALRTGEHEHGHERELEARGGQRAQAARTPQEWQAQ